MTNTDNIRTLTNSVELSGILAELSEVREGLTKEGNIPYVSFNGAIQCGDTPDSTVKFRTFVKSKKADGSESKIFAKVKNWAYTAVPLTRAASMAQATKVDLVGSVTDNPYVNDKKELKEATQFNMQLINDFKTYKANIRLEGFIHSFSDELDSDGNPTGRRKMRLISRDFFRNMLDIKEIIIPEELVEAVENNNYDRGCTATFFVKLSPVIKNRAPKSNGGIGVRNTEVSSYTYLEWLLTGADPVISMDDERALDAKLIKEAMRERAVKLEGIVKKKEQEVSQPAPKATGIGTANTLANDPITEDEEFPF